MSVLTARILNTTKHLQPRPDKMDPYRITIDTYNRVAKAYEDRFMELDLYNDTYDAFCKLLADDANVLETGCGPGNITRYMLREKPGLKFLATDLSQAMLELAKKKQSFGRMYDPGCPHDRQPQPYVQCRCMRFLLSLPLCSGY